MSLVKKERKKGREKKHKGFGWYSAKHEFHMLEGKNRPMRKRVQEIKCLIKGNVFYDFVYSLVLSLLSELIMNKKRRGKWKVIFSIDYGFKPGM